MKIFKEISNNNLLSSSVYEETDKSLSLIYFKDNISKTIVEFYNSLSDEKKKLFAMNIFMKYSRKKEEKEKNNDNNINENEAKETNENKIEETKNYIIENIDSINLLGIEKEEKNNKKEKPKKKWEGK